MMSSETDLYTAKEKAKSAMQTAVAAYYKVAKEFEIDDLEIGDEISDAVLAATEQEIEL